MQNIVLIGMPGAGKSTIGVLLAKHLSMDFIDTDLLIQNRREMTLQQILDRHGYLHLRQVEEEEILVLETQNTVIATGGSAVYSAKAMEHLHCGSVVVYLKVDIDEIRRRIGDYSMRGIAKAPNQSFEDLFNERGLLYDRYGDIAIECAGKCHEEVVGEIAQCVLTVRNRQKAERSMDCL